MQGGGDESENDFDEDKDGEGNKGDSDNDPIQGSHRRDDLGHSGGGGGEGHRGSEEPWNGDIDIDDRSGNKELGTGNVYDNDRRGDEEEDYRYQYLVDDEDDKDSDSDEPLDVVDDALGPENGEGDVDKIIAVCNKDGDATFLG